MREIFDPGPPFDIGIRREMTAEDAKAKYPELAGKIDEARSPCRAMEVDEDELIVRVSREIGREVRHVLAEHNMDITCHEDAALGRTVRRLLADYDVARITELKYIRMMLADARATMLTPSWPSQWLSNSPAGLGGTIALFEPYQGAHSQGTVNDHPFARAK